jgi:hypothetical protein
MHLDVNIVEYDTKIGSNPHFNVFLKRFSCAAIARLAQSLTP